MQKARTIFLMSAAMLLGAETACSQQHTNNFLLQRFTNEGSSSYDWRYEPFKTDLQRGWFKGNVVKVITDIRDVSGTGFGDDHLADTTFYDSRGNFSKIIEKNMNAGISNVPLRPSVYTFKYDQSGLLTGYTVKGESQAHDFSANVDYVSKTIVYHDVTRDSHGRMSKEYACTSSTDRNGNWEKVGSEEQDLSWTFLYDANGNLISGYNNLLTDWKVTYSNGRLTKLQLPNSKPETLTYDANGRLTQHRYFAEDGMDEIEHLDFTTTFTYNDHGDFATVKRTVWNCNSNWQRRKVDYSDTYTFKYTYDDTGNWTKVTVYGKHNAGKPEEYYIITREITYGNKPTTAQTSNMKMPTFIGNVGTWLSQNLVYPQNAWNQGIQGKVVVRFLVSEDGSVTNVELAKSENPELDAEALRVVKAMPK